jgi:hypothetical protein
VTSALELPAESGTDGLADTVTELADATATVDEEVVVEGVLPLPENPESTTAQTGTSAAEASRIIDTKMASDTAPLCGDLGRVPAFPALRRT